jgi:hypothetical protein
MIKNHLKINLISLLLNDNHLIKIDNGGAKRDRTADLLRARQALSQLSYSPKYSWVSVRASLYKTFVFFVA